ncbi:cysteine hydrolase family protein [Pseudonocardia ailaonensis]|uniref:Cysteine hydrolase family protein n=1 Tax=Pseudonocardia ailaonensis TaxID=367279 RepID=A0ABN2MR06_9PSEU
MSDLTTLRAVSGLPAEPPALSASTLVMVDCQNTYTRGLMELDGVQAALDQAEELLDRARSAGIPVVHIQHDAGAGSPYDVREEIGAIVDRVAPRDGEPTVVKNFPNSFTQTELDTILKRHGERPLLLAGFMTHMCINSTARGAFSLGYSPTVVGGATATRSLPGSAGSAEVPSGSLQAASLASIADLFGVVVAGQSDIPD